MSIYTNLILNVFIQYKTVAVSCCFLIFWTKYGRVWRRKWLLILLTSAVLTRNVSCFLWTVLR